MSSPDSSGAAAPRGGRRRKTAEAAEAEAIEGLGAPAPGRRSSRSRRGGRKRRGKVLPLLLGALGLAVAALAVVLGLQFFSSGPTAPENARPSSYTVYESDTMSDVIGSQEVDSRALSEGEMFERGNDELEAQGITFTLGAHSMSEDCASAVWGDAIATALDDAGCTQVAQAAYQADDHVGATAMFNLRDAEAAQAVAEALNQPDELEAEGPGFITNPATEDPFTRLGTGFSRAEASVNGHYLLVSWAQSVDSESPGEHEDLTSPLIALNSFKDPLYRRVVELENMQNQGGGAGTGTEQGTGSGTGTESGTGAEQGAGTESGTGTGAGAGTAG